MIMPYELFIDHPRDGRQYPQQQQQNAKSGQTKPIYLPILVLLKENIVMEKLDEINKYTGQRSREIVGSPKYEETVIIIIQDSPSSE